MPVMLVILLLLIPALVFADMPPVTAPPTDPTEFGSLRMDPFESVAPPEGDWVVAVTASYFNQWNGTWHTRRSHEDRGLAGQPIQDEELRALEQAFPDDDIYRVDLEGSRLDLLVARGFANGTALHVRVPWIAIGDPSWDGVAEEFHSLVPVVDHYVRDLFPRGQTFLYLRTPDRATTRREELARSGIGDVAVSLGVPLRKTHRIVLALELPTGEEDSLHGSGGYDGGLRWFASREGERHRWLVGAGFTFQDPGGSFLGFERSSTFHFSADFVRTLSSRTALHAAARLDTSPLRGITGTNLADPVVFYRLGFQVQSGSGRWLSFEVGEEIAPQIGVDTDFSFHLGYSLRR